MAQNNDNKKIEEVQPNTSKSQVALNEERILKFWQDNKVFNESLKKNEGKKEYVFYDGPPFATGLPHYGHILGSTVKDVIPRYQTMRGHYVSRKWGWDCHGLPIENIVEKDLKISGKKQIEEIGVEKFNEHARSKVLEYIHEWKETVDRIGRWVDFDGSYKTMDNTYIESVWWALKELNNKDLIYEGTKVLPYCPRCETPIANSEIAMDNSYKDITDISVYVTFELKDEPGTHLVAWTTTPWTLPGNTALSVNRDLVYSKVELTASKKADAKIPSGFFVIAKDRLEVVLKEYEYNVVGELTGDDLVGKAYQPVFDYYLNANLKNKDNGWKVYAGAFVTAESGTGIVHIAPGFGEDDMRLAKDYSLPVILHVGQDGKFKDEVVDFAGKLVKPKSTKEERELHQSTDVEIIKYLARNGKLFAKEKIIHSYPHCFRCETPLYYFALPAWFIKITEVKDKLLLENENIHWVPEHLKEGRFKKIVEGAPDWNISRNRYWASPLPIWKCDSCAHTEFVGSLQELKDKKRSSNTFIVMRHGEAENNVRNVVNSNIKDNTFGLTEKGKEQVRAAVDKLKGKNFDMVFASPFLRTQQTAEIVTSLGIPKEKVATDARLGEINTGEFEGKSIDEYHAFSLSHTDRFVDGPKGGENYSEVRRRIMEFVYEVDSKNEGKTFLIVTHDTPGWLLFAGSQGKNAKETLAYHGTGKFFFQNAEVKELEFAPLPHNAQYELDLHRPYIDAVMWSCNTCKGGIMKRIPEVIDCWFESGSMPFAQVHYPFQNKEWFTNHFPAQFISEYIAQTRTWFYYTHALGVMLFGSNAYEHVVTSGTVLAEDGQKMSKSKGNFPNPWILFNKYGVDALRYYLMSSPVIRSEDLKFSEKGVDEVYKKIILRLNNVLSFYEMYIGDGNVQGTDTSANPLDKWILSRLNEVVRDVTEAMEAYKLGVAIAPLDLFVDDLSTWYLRRSRERFKGEEKEKIVALGTLRFVLHRLAKVMAPFTPFVAEMMYEKVKDEHEPMSVHVTDWPEEGDINASLIESMKAVRHVVSIALEARSKAGIKVRQPLSTLRVRSSIENNLLELIRDEVNVKEVLVGEEIAYEIELDTVITPELKSEGIYRELLRSVQDLRKQQGLVPNDRVVLTVEANDEGKKIVDLYLNELKKVAGLKDVVFDSLQDVEEIKIDEYIFKMAIVK